MKTIIIICLSVIILGGGVFIFVDKNNTGTPQDPAQQNVENNASPKPSSQTKTSSILDLSGQGLTKAPNDVFVKTNIDELNLSNNKITGSLQAEVRNLTNLKVLNLSNNMFSGVPAEIGQLSKLEVLNLSNNLITGLPLELGNLKNLKVLDLRGNAYSSFDLEIIKKTLSSGVTILVD